MAEHKDSYMLSWYEKLYPIVDESKVYSEYCTKVFGMDLSQQGFSTMNQINFMLDKLKLGNKHKAVDIGCGTGKLIECN